MRRTNNEDTIVTLNLFGQFEADRGRRGEEGKLKTYLLTIGNFSEYIHKEFGLEKCAKIVAKWKIISLTNLVLDIITALQYLEQGNICAGGKVKLYIYI